MVNFDIHYVLFVTLLSEDLKDMFLRVLSNNLSCYFSGIRGLWYIGLCKYLNRRNKIEDVIVKYSNKISETALKSVIKKNDIKLGMLLVVCLAYREARFDFSMKKKASLFSIQNPYLDTQTIGAFNVLGEVIQAWSLMFRLGDVWGSLR